MRKNPVFAATAIVTLALGIGANTAIFSVIRAVLLKPLNYREPDRLVSVSGGATWMHVEEFQKAARSYDGTGAFLNMVENVTLSGRSGSEVLKAARVSANFLDILGVAPVLGRTFRPEEEAPGGPPVTMISADLWRRRFEADPSIAGHAATLAGTPHTIIGVLPAGFQFPFSGIDVWVTKPSQYVQPLSPLFAIFGRLKPGIDVRRASAELAILNQAYAQAHPGMLDGKRKTPAQVVPFKDGLVSRVRAMLWMLFGAVAFVLWIACANVASLLLARAASRSREFAVRAALGAARTRLISQLLAESLLLSLAGGASGLLLARWSLTAITKTTAFDLPRLTEVRVDGVVLAFALLLSVLTGVLFGLVPSFRAGRPDVAGVLRTSGEAAASKPVVRGFGLRDMLVTGQVVLSVVLLIGAALLMESLAHLHGLDLGFQPANLLTMRISLAPSRYDSDAKKALFYRELGRRVEALPGVRAATVTLTLPLTGYAGTPVQNAAEPPLLLNQRPIATIQLISPDYFRTLGIRLQRGRFFSERDDLAAPLVAIIAEDLARRFWPAYPKGPDPVGQHLLIGSNPKPAEIVGVVANIHQNFEDAWPGIYRPCSQTPAGAAMFAVRTTGNPLQFAGEVRHQVLAIDPDQPVSEVKTMEAIVEAEQGQRRVLPVLLGFFAGLALLLAAVGLYGAIAYSVVQKTKELGIRQALGAKQSDILALVLGQSLGLTLTGVVLGTAAASALTQVMKSFLFQVSPTDPAAFIGVALVFLIVASLAAYIPARQALRIDPVTALQS